MTDSNLNDDITPSMREFSEQSIDELIKVAGPRPTVSEERSTRAYKAVHEVWLNKINERKKPRPYLVWAKALAACAIISVTAFFIASTLIQPEAIIVAHISKINGSATIIRQHQPSEISEGVSVYSGQVLKTYTHGGVATTFSQGQSLRLDENTEIRFISPLEIELIQGAVYFDSGTNARQMKPLNIHTPYGIVSDIGTQFEVRLTQEDIQIQVREGEVRLNSKSGNNHKLVAQEKLLVDNNGQSTLTHIAPDSLEWSWTQALAPLFDFESHSVDEFLTWFSRENGLSLHYATQEIKQYAIKTQLHGNIAGLNTKEILQTVAIISEIDFQLNEWILSIHPKKTPDSPSE